jgi:hypothetical protein
VKDIITINYRGINYKSSESGTNMSASHSVEKLSVEFNSSPSLFLKSSMIPNRPIPYSLKQKFMFLSRVTSRLIRSIENYWEIPIMSSCTLNGMYLHHRLVLRRPKMRVA